MDFFSIIGTIASIGSIPLSLYLFIKSRENNIDKVKREIVKTLSHQIGDRRQLTSFEIQTVINSKTRDSKIDVEKIKVSHIIEDLVAETISNPLLDKSIKETIINELKNIYFKGELLTKIDEIEIETRINNNKQPNNNIESEIKTIIDKRNELRKEIDSHKKRYIKTSEIFGLISVITTLIAAMLTFIGRDKLDNLSKPIELFLQKNDIYVALITGVAVSIIASLVASLSKYFKNR